MCLRRTSRSSILFHAIIIITEASGITIVDSLANGHLPCMLLKAPGMFCGIEGCGIWLKDRLRGSRRGA